MCGIVGFWERGGSRDLLRTGMRMTDAIRHRGPDDDGHFADADAALFLGHRRLSIIDVSPLGHQPMESRSGRYVIVYNGEAYNFAEVKRELERLGHAFRGGSDTEVLLAAFEQWGLDEGLPRFVGMFAMAVWDRRDRALNLVRDRVGVKPLYYGWSGGTLLFGSELKALRAHPAFRAGVDRDALDQYMGRGYVPGPRSIYQGIFKLPPGTILTLPAADARDAEPRPYWSAMEVMQHGLQTPFVGSDEEAKERLTDILRDSIRLRMVSDVPIGAFLSGGVDSSLVTALMQEQSGQSVKTFSIGSDHQTYDEAHYAAAVAQHLGTDHTELYVTGQEALEVVPAIPEMYDEPFADSSQIPTFLVSRLARTQVTVALSGDGGDELFAGYNRHVWAPRLWKQIDRLPRWARGIASGAMTGLSPERWNAFYDALSTLLPSGARHRSPGHKLHKLAGVLRSRTQDDMYRLLVSQWHGRVVLGATADASDSAGFQRLDERIGFAERMMYHDLVSYLPDDILVKVDRASMAVSLEAREPLLDHRLIEFAWSLPLTLKVRSGVSKWLLREVLYQYVPRSLIERPKSGFGVPIEAWLRGPLRDWAEDLLDERRLREGGLLDPAPIRRAWDDHLAGRGSWHHALWSVLMFQAWSRHEPVSAARAA